MATPEAEKAAKPRNLHRSYVATPKDAAANRAWWVIDATDKPLGRLASHVASVLRGKHKPTFTPHEDAGDFVIVVNADKVKLTGNKLDQKLYSHHSGIPGGFKQVSYRTLLAKKPEFPIEKAVKGMLPKGPLGYAMLKKMKCYAGDAHPHTAQQPKVLEI